MPHTFMAGVKLQKILVYMQLPPGIVIKTDVVAGNTAAEAIWPELPFDSELRRSGSDSGDARRANESWLRQCVGALYIITYYFLSTYYIKR